MISEIFCTQGRLCFTKLQRKLIFSGLEYSNNGVAAEKTNNYRDCDNENYRQTYYKHFTHFLHFSCRHR